MVKDKGGPVPISEESIGYLEDVKKGKPRKFAMICKGTAVISLVVYKKGNVEKRRKEAKESGKGQFYFGVVDGKGIDLRFMLARTDGFDSPPVKTTVLKGFLEEEAEFKCKPLFEIVEVAQLVIDDTDPLAARFLQLQAAALAACEAQPDAAPLINTLCRQIGSSFDEDQTDQAARLLLELEAILANLSAPTGDSGGAAVSEAAVVLTPPSEAEKGPTGEQASGSTQPLPSAAEAEFTARFKALLPAIKAASESLGEALKQRARQAAEFAQQQDYPQANGLLDQVDELLRTSESTPVKPDPELEFKRRLQEMLPEIQRAKIENSSSAQQVTLLSSEAATLARKRDFIGANQLLERVARMLEQLARPGGDEASQFTARLKQLKPNIDQALKIDSPASRDLKLIVSQAAALARQREFAQALLILDKVETLIGQVVAGATGGASTMGPTLESADFLRLQLRWRDAQATAAEQLAELGRQLMLLPEVQGDSRVAEVEQVAARLPQFIPKFGNVLTNYLQRAAQGGPDVEQCRQDALRSVVIYRQQLVGAPVLRQLAEFAHKNLKVQLSSAAELEAALLDVETGLTTAT